MDENLATIYNAILDGDMAGAEHGVQAALAADLQPEDILNGGMIAAMSEVGRRFEEGDYYVPEMLVAARAMQAVLSLLKPGLVALSALLTTTMPHMKTTVDAIEQAGLRDRVRIIVGGAPVTHRYANEIGTDGFSPDASSVPGLVTSLLQADH